jgi:hypothetical protein
MKPNPSSPFRSPIDPDLDDLLHPAQAFEHPQDVVNDPDLTVNEKRAILASWASDACAIEAAPALRRSPGGRKCVAIDDILDALRTLDRLARAETQQSTWARRQVRREALSAFRRQRGSPRGSPSDLAQ